MADDGLSNGDWAEHRRLILYRFDQLDSKVDELREDVEKLREAQINLRMKVAAFGGTSGLLGWGIPQLIKLIAQNGG